MVRGWLSSAGLKNATSAGFKKCERRGHPSRLDRSSNSLQRNDMIRTQLRVLLTVAVFGAAVGLAGRGPTRLLATAPAVAAGAAVTPKTEVPNEARALSHAFSNVAKALGSSVVRIEVEVGGPRGASPHGRLPNDDGGDDNDVPPLFRHFFQ